MRFSVWRLATAAMAVVLSTLLLGVGVSDLAAADSPKTSGPEGVQAKLDELSSKQAASKQAVESARSAAGEAAENAKSWSTSAERHRDTIDKLKAEMAAAPPRERKFYEEKISGETDSLAAATKAAKRFSDIADENRRNEVIALGDLAAVESQIDTLRGGLKDKRELTREEIGKQVEEGKAKVKELLAELRQVKAMVDAGDTSPEVRAALARIKAYTNERADATMKLNDQLKAIEAKSRPDKGK